jgi:hypothetical protein
VFGSVHSLRLELCAHFSLSHACHILRQSTSRWLLSPFMHHPSSGSFFFLQNPFFSSYLISRSYTGWETMFQTNPKQCVKLQFCPFLYLCCQSDRLLCCCDLGLECHLGRKRQLFFCLWHAVSPMQRVTAPTKVSYQMSMTVQSQAAVGRTGQ